MMLNKNKRPVFTDELIETEFSDEQLVEIPLLGNITAGQPIERIEDNSEMVSVPGNMVKHNTYALKVKGHSMVDDNIQDGDVVIIEKTSSASEGQSVVCLINQEEVTLKKFYIEKKGIRLQPANPDMKPIYLQNHEVEILGVVSGVIRRYI
ncbi:MAG: repressor LexA [Gammaproteobacteria bacterium]|nr:repressor LexA [Gammaproteobacteria bacterium]